MTTIERFDINLEHDIDEQYQYEPGQVLRGTVVLRLRESIMMKAITLQLKGEATVAWEEDGGGRGPPRGYSADETYIDKAETLVQPPRNQPSIHLGKGLHEFPMEYTLPVNIPSSFIGKYGSITYVVKATLKEDKKFGMSTMITSEPFLVLRQLDLSADEASLLQPAETRVEKRLWGAVLCCMSGKVAVVLKLNKAGHLPGEDIYLDAEITNSSPRMVRAVQAAIVMHSTFHARNKSRENTQTVNKKRDEWEMSYGEGRRWKNVRLTIPPYIPESRLDGCDIIDIKYELMFKAEVDGGGDIYINVPITVGTSQGKDKENGNDAQDSTKQYVPRYRKKDDKINILEQDDVKVAVDESEDKDKEEPEKFRYPINPGETRLNPIFADG